MKKVYLKDVVEVAKESKWCLLTSVALPRDLPREEKYNLYIYKNEKKELLTKYDHRMQKDFIEIDDSINTNKPFLWDGWCYYPFMIKKKTPKIDME